MVGTKYFSHLQTTVRLQNCDRNHQVSFSLASSDHLLSQHIPHSWSFLCRKMSACFFFFSLLSFVEDFAKEMITVCEKIFFYYNSHHCTWVFDVFLTLCKRMKAQLQIDKFVSHFFSCILPLLSSLSNFNVCISGIKKLLNLNYSKNISFMIFVCFCSLT